MVLRSLPNIHEQVQEILPPPRTCEACGKVVAVGHDAINFIAVIGSPGHPDLMPFQCAYTEHWACSIECWKIVAHACIDEHILPLLQAAHNRIAQK
jgi:hypothetical protein